MGKFQRRKYIVKKEFQAKFIGRTLCVSAFGGMVSIAFFYYLALQKIDSVLFSMSVPISGISNILLKEALYANAAAATLVAVVFALSVRTIHHRIATPLRRIRAELTRLANGDLSSGANLGQTSEFKDFADDLNIMAKELNRRFSDIRENCKRINKSARELPWVSEGDYGSLKENIFQEIELLEKKIGEFKR